jgi:P2-related tail formation protein
LEWENAFAQSALQVCKASAWICQETGDGDGVVLAILDSLMTTQSENSGSYLWAMQVTNAIVDQELRAEALRLIDRAKRRWRGGACQQL